MLKPRRPKTPPPPRRKACNACANAKVRFDQNPGVCRRCHLRGLSCIYPSGNIPKDSKHFIAPTNATHLSPFHADLESILDPTPQALIGQLESTHHESPRELQTSYGFTPGVSDHSVPAKETLEPFHGQEEHGKIDNTPKFDDHVGGDLICSIDASSTSIRQHSYSQFETVSEPFQLGDLPVSSPPLRNETLLT